MRNSKETIYQISAIFILASAVLYLFEPIVAPWIMAVSVFVFTIITAKTPYPGKSLRGKRLFSFQVFACVLMAIATYLMFRNSNLWSLAMIIGAVFLLYSVIMIPKELEKENLNDEK